MTSPAGSCAHVHVPPTHEQLVRLLRITLKAHGDDPEALATLLVRVNAMCCLCRDRALIELEVYTLQALTLLKSGASAEDAAAIIEARRQEDAQRRSGGA